MKYIGHQMTYNNVIDEKSVTLIPNQEYEVAFEYEGPQAIINGRPIYAPTGTMWAHVDGVAIPYAPDVVEKFWER